MNRARIGIYRPLGSTQGVRDRAVEGLLLRFRQQPGFISRLENL